MRGLVADSWLRAFQALGLPFHHIRDAAAAAPGTLYFFRVNQMFRSGRLIDDPSLGSEVFADLQQVEARAGRDATEKLQLITYA